ARARRTWGMLPMGSLPELGLKSCGASIKFQSMAPKRPITEKTDDLDRDECLEIIGTCACFNFRKASRSVTQLFDQILAPIGLRSTQLTILITGRLLGPSSIARVARELVMDRSTLTRNLKPLLTMGLLKLSKPVSGKHKSVELTEEGL